MLNVQNGRYASSRIRTTCKLVLIMGSKTVNIVGITTTSALSWFLALTSIDLSKKTNERVQEQPVLPLVPISANIAPEGKSAYSNMV